MKKLIAKLMAGIAKGAMLVGKGGKAAYDFGAGVVTGAVGMVFGRGGGAPVPAQATADEVIEELMAANAAAIDDDDELTPEEQLKKAEELAVNRAFHGGPNGQGMEPKDVLDYATAPTLAKRQEIGGLMRNQTRDWLMSMNNTQLDSLGRAGEYGIRSHMHNIRHISNVPKLTFGTKYEMELSHKEPAPQAPKPQGSWTERRDKIAGIEAPKNRVKFAEGFHRQIDMMADQDQDREQTRNSAPAYRPKPAGMRR